jgi:hypothetical protein
MFKCLLALELLEIISNFRVITLIPADVQMIFYEYM